MGFGQAAPRHRDCCRASSHCSLCALCGAARRLFSPGTAASRPGREDTSLNLGGGGRAVPLAVPRAPSHPAQGEAGRGCSPPRSPGTEGSSVRRQGCVSQHSSFTNNPNACHPGKAQPNSWAVVSESQQCLASSCLLFPSTVSTRLQWQEEMLCRFVPTPRQRAVTTGMLGRPRAHPGCVRCTKNDPHGLL